MATLNWGLVGYGDLAEKRVAAALQNAAGSALGGVWGRDGARTRDFAGRHGIGQAHESLEALLGSDVDAVYICTPPASHCEYALAALRAGKHVLVEKPMESSVAECEAMIAAAAAAERTLGVAYYRRAFPKMQKVRELIQQGTLGQVTWVNIAAHSWFAPSPDDPKHWRVEKAASGGAGALADIGVHRLDLLDFWLGPSRVCLSDLQHLVHRDSHYEVEDGASAVLQLAGGASAHGAPVHTYFAWNSQTWMDRFEIVGSAGKIIVEPLDGAPLVVIRGRDREELAIEPPANAHQPLVEDFVRAALSGGTPLCDGEAGLRTTRLMEELVDQAMAGQATVGNATVGNAKVGNA